MSNTDIQQELLILSTMSEVDMRRRVAMIKAIYGVDLWPYIIKTNASRY